MSINNAVLVGRLSRDPETVWTNMGTCVLDFSLAVNTPKKESDGSWTDEVSFFDCAMYGKRAENLSEILHKGMKVTVEGRLQQQRWQNQQGENRSKVRVVVSQVELPPRHTFDTPENDFHDHTRQGYGNASPQAQIDPYEVAEQFGGTVTLPDGDDVPF